MLAGFLRGVGPDIGLSCAVPFDRDSQRRRFPQIQWLSYDLGARANAVDACDAWVGVGDTPFQQVVGDWFYDHLAEELKLCRRYAKPMFFIGVGVNERGALAHSVARSLLEYATHIWTRDAQSARWISEACGAQKVSTSADLAHIWLRSRGLPASEADVDGLVLNFEDPAQLDIAALARWLAANPRRQRWLVQEVRNLRGSERDIFANLPPDAQARLAIAQPDYSHADMAELLRPWGNPGRLITSRYHAAVVGAWGGARLLSISRSDKIRGLVEQLGVETVASFTDAQEIEHALARARPAQREKLLALADQAEQSCQQLRQRILPAAGRSRTPTAMRNRSSLGSVEELESPLFTSFMQMMNAFAAAHGLRTFTNWTKVWEYPWLWHTGLGDMNWRETRVVDLGSEISPMPWFLATLGASVRLLEVDDQWTPTWEKLREQLRVDVTWDIVRSEAIPLPDGWADAVTSLSVIEHQPDKAAAIAEVARVLRPGGLFAASFDICEPEMGMTFPQWNGQALTAQEFADLLWLHPAFGEQNRPQWDWSAAPAFKQWHLQSAPHHNYIVGAAVLWKK